MGSIKTFQFSFQSVDSRFRFAHFLGAVANAVAFVKQPFQLIQLHILDFPDLPVQGIPLGNQVGLERLASSPRMPLALVR